MRNIGDMFIEILKMVVIPKVMRDLYHLMVKVEDLEEILVIALIL